MPPPVLQLVVVVLLPDESNTNFCDHVEIQEAKTGLQVQMTFQVSLKLFSDNLSWANAIKSANYMLAKLNWLTPMSNCFHVLHMLGCIVFACTKCGMK